MKTVKNLVLFGILMSAFLSSCTMQKCVYSKGYYVDWFDVKSKKMKLEKTEEVSLTEVEESNVPFTQNLNEVMEARHVETVDENSAGEPIALASVDNNEINISKSTRSESVSSSKEISSFRNEFKNGVGVIMSPPDDQKTNGMALAGFTCSLAGLFIFGVVLGILGIIFSAIGLAKISKDSAKWKGKGMAIAGLIVGVIDIVVMIVLLALVI